MTNLPPDDLRVRVWSTSKKSMPAMLRRLPARGETRNGRIFRPTRRRRRESSNQTDWLPGNVLRGRGSRGSWAAPTRGPWKRIEHDPAAVRSSYPVQCAGHEAAPGFIRDLHRGAAPVRRRDLDDGGLALLEGAQRKGNRGVLVNPCSPRGKSGNRASRETVKSGESSRRRYSTRMRAPSLPSTPSSSRRPVPRSLSKEKELSVLKVRRLRPATDHTLARPAAA